MHVRPLYIIPLRLKYMTSLIFFVRLTICHFYKYFSKSINQGNLVDWDTVQKPKDKGGLGTISLELQNDALLVKHTHKFYNQKEIPRFS
jgi:hypothetical protein